MAIFNGTSGNDNFNGTSDADTFNLQQGGDDSAFGGLHSDVFFLGAELTAADTLNGGSDFDQVVLTGDYSAGLTLGATTIVNIEELRFDAGFDYRVTTVDENVGASLQLQINARFLGAGETLTFNGSAETNGKFLITDGAGDDKLTTGAGNDSISLWSGGIDKVTAGAGLDTIRIQSDFLDLVGRLEKSDRIDGGVDADRLFLDGDYSTGVILGQKTLLGIERISLATLTAAHEYRLTFADGNVAAATSLLVDTPNPNLVTFMKLDGSAETDGVFEFIAGNGNDVLIGGAGDDEITGGAGADRIIGGGGADTLFVNATSHSTSSGYDIIVGFDTAQDIFDLASGGAGGIGPTVCNGRLSTGNFDNQLANAIGDGELGLNQAVIFKPDDGNLAGHIFLVVDRNLVAGYQAGADMVFELVEPVHLGALNAGNII
jgi:Ca2+-binding RTX toxin-like protein